MAGAWTGRRGVGLLARMSRTQVELGDTVVMAAAGVATSEPRSDGGPRVGAVLAGRYELLAVLGSGGMGTVCSAHDRELDEVVALKLLRPEIAAAPGGQDRFRREVKLARRITHRNVARTFELGEHAGERFLTMEFVAGESLAQRLRQRGRLAIGRAAPIFLAVCEALEAAHEAGIVHRDIKPDNVLLEASGRVVVTDFGIAALRDQSEAGVPLGATPGTPAYMAPEQLEGQLPTPQTDLYALGAMMFARYQSIRGLRADLERCLGGLPAVRRPARAAGVPAYPRAGARAPTRSPTRSGAEAGVHRSMRPENQRITAS